LDQTPLRTLSDFERLLGQQVTSAGPTEVLLNANLFLSPVGSKDTARFHADLVDQILGFEIRQIEQRLFAEARDLTPAGDLASWGHGLHQGNQTWVGLSPQTLLTPYSELRLMCQLLQPLPGQQVVDLGAGYGRLGLVLHQLYPQVFFTGVEFVPERVVEGQRILAEFGCVHARLVQGDLSSEDFILPHADFYFIYDYGKIPHIRRTLRQLEAMAVERKFTIIARGQGTRSLIHHEHPWLTYIQEPLHEEFFSIYRF
jgi:hypothetical protein